jgi:hypothetical protein
MTKPFVLVIGLLALVLAATAGAAPTVTLASPGPTPFAGCTADQVDLQKQVLGSTLYPGSEIEPRSARFGSTIVAGTSRTVGRMAAHADS